MRVFAIAGEPSGDRLGGAALAGLRAIEPDLQVEGVGGPLMAEQGLASRFPMEELSVMGLAEVLPRLLPLLRRIEETAQAVAAARPDVLLTIDSPDFCLRVAKRVRALAPAIRTVHYVAPTVWAWRPGRARKMARFIDHVLALFPFEPPLMQAEGMACDFVGHPVVAEPVATEAEARAFRRAHGLTGPMVLVLPGSRRSEVERLSATFGEALGLLARERPGLRAVLPAAGPVLDLVRERTSAWPLKPLILQPRSDPLAIAARRAAFRAADVALAASGTVSLELAASGMPMVIGYDPPWLTWQMARLMVRLDTATLVNIVSQTRAVPEFLGPACRPGPIAGGLARVLDAPDAQRAAMALTMERLGAGGEPPGLRAARAIRDGWRAAQAAERIQPPPSTRVPSGA